MNIKFDEHAKLRMSQRNLSQAEIETVVRYGRKIHRSGAVFYFLGKRNLPPGREKQFERLEGTTVVVYHAEIKTAYRNRLAIQSIKRKKKHRKNRIVICRRWN